jgi:glycosyltransferase involved in cell wall biosynthesis
MSRISVVIPVLDDAGMLAICLAALADQTRPADEIIVVDNGSADDSVDVAARAGARVITESVRGIWPAAATGFDAATGDVIARLDADSVPSRTWLEQIEATFDTDPEITVVTGTGDFYGATPFARFFGRVIFLGAYFSLMKVWLGHTTIYGSNFAIRRAAWSRVRLLVHRDLREIHDDFDLAFHLQPDMVVRYDRTLRVAVSARPVETFAGLKRRVVWGLKTLTVHFPEFTPWRWHAARHRYLVGRRRAAAAAAAAVAEHDRAA